MSFKRAEQLYTIDWSKPVKVKIGEWIPESEQPKKLRTVLLPTMPPEEEFVNYGLPVKDQKFVKRPVPKDIKFWEQRDIDAYVEAEWKRRKNGYWILIRGNPYYITGPADAFFNFWTAQTGLVPEFRFGQLEWFYEWFDVERDKNCFGKLDIKCRRIGDTELALFAVWERTTRYSDSDSGTVHLKKESAIKNLNRLIKGNNGMPFFYKPINSGTTDSKGGELRFAIPGEMVTTKRLREGYFDKSGETGLRSSIYAEPATTLAFDGVQLRCHYIDEAFKHLNQGKFNIREHWENIKKTMSLNNDELIVGKAIITSTIEEVDDGNALEAAQKMVDDSLDIKPDGRSVTGLRVVFRGYHYGTKTDEWGFHLVAEAKKKRDANIAYLREKKQFRQLTHVYRKTPATLEEALSAIAGDCIFYPEFCEERLRQLDKGVDRNNKPQKKLGEFGDLIWKDGLFNSTVVWVPNPKGKWFITQHPEVPNNKLFVRGKPYPGSMTKYRMGCDPYDARVVEGKGSDGSFVVKRLLDLRAEPEEILLDKNGIPINVEDMMTNQPVCDYTGREENPHDFYDHVYRTCVYFGVAVYPEMNKPGLEAWLESKDLGYYVQVRPEKLIAASSRKNRNDIKGSDNTPKTIANWTDLCKMYIYSYIWCCRHPRLINNWKRFTVKDRTKFDLSTAYGYTELAEIETRFTERPQESVESRWEVPFEEYENQSNYN